MAHGSTYCSVTSKQAFLPYRISSLLSSFGRREKQNVKEGHIIHSRLLLIEGAQREHNDMLQGREHEMEMGPRAGVR